jgi:RNA recognition motif-containing protein
MMAANNNNNKQKKKSKAQINRLLKRAEARGEAYEIPVPDADDKNDDVVKAAAATTTSQEEQVRDDDDDDDVAFSADKDQATTKSRDSSSRTSSKSTCSDVDHNVELKRKIAVELKQSLENIANAGGAALKAKERRSAKRKAEAIAAEKAGCSAEKLLTWLEKEQQAEEQEQLKAISTSTVKDKIKVRQEGGGGGGDSGDAKQKKNPYIVFIGQLSYETTKESLLAHIQKELEKEVDESGQRFAINADTVSIRLLTDRKTKKSRGMAFVEVQDPQLLYACLKLHLTHLQGRRLNVERSAGGKATSTSRQVKIQELRKEQQSHMQSVVETMLQEHYDQGTIRPGEIDDGVIALCRRHAAPVVQAALERYCESQGRDMDNPSAYLTFLLGKLAEEGIFERNEDLQQQDKNHNRKKKQREVIAGASSSPRFNKKQKTTKYDSSSSSSARGGFNQKNNHHHHHDNKRHNGPSTKYMSSPSVFAKQGIDMSISDTTTTGHTKDLSSIFPSISSRGGRGKA